MAQTETEVVKGIGSDYEVKYGFHVPEDYFFKSGRGLSHELVDAISSHKDEPAWMRKFRHKSLEYFNARPLPAWGGDVTTIDFDNIYYYIKPTETQAKSWEDLPDDIKDTWDRLGIPEAERKFLAGVGAQYESEVVYHKLREDLEEQGVLFLDIQASHSTLREELPLLLPYLARPDVHLGVDPEFYMHHDKEGVRPSAKIGQMKASDINYVVQTLDRLVTEKKLPPKVLVVHRFTRLMVPDAQQIRLTPRVQVVMHMDGWGPPWLKFDSYHHYIVNDPVQFTGFKLFYHNDTKKGDPLLTPAEVLRLHPQPLYIQYQ